MQTVHRIVEKAGLTQAGLSAKVGLTTATIAEAGENLELWRCHIDEIREQDRNARTMAPEMMERLSLNIKREKRLESIPLTVKRKDYFELISGHHRVRACRSAGIETIIVLADTRDLDRSQIVAKQLAHNAIDGQDDRNTLLLLLEEVSRVEDLLESFTSLEKWEPPEPTQIDDVEIQFDVRYMAFVFLSSQFKDFDRLCALLPSELNLACVADRQAFEEFRDTMIRMGKAENIRSIGSIISRMIQICEQHLSKSENPGPS